MIISEVTLEVLNNNRLNDIPPKEMRILLHPVREANLQEHHQPPGTPIRHKAPHQPAQDRECQVSQLISNLPSLPLGQFQALQDPPGFCGQQGVQSELLRQPQ